MNTNKPIVQLVGRDGNAYAILGACQKAARKAKWSHKRIQAFFEEAKSGSYANLLQVVTNHFEVI